MLVIAMVNKPWNCFTIPNSMDCYCVLFYHSTTILIVHKLPSNWVMAVGNIPIKPVINIDGF